MKRPLIQYLLFPFKVIGWAAAKVWYFFSGADEEEDENQ